MLQNSLNLVHSALPAFPEIPYPHALRAKRLVKEKKKSLMMLSLGPLRVVIFSRFYVIGGVN